MFKIKTGEENYSTYYCVKCNVLTFLIHFMLHSGDQVSHQCKTMGKVIVLKYFIFYICRRTVLTHSLLNIHCSLLLPLPFMKLRN